VRLRRISFPLFLTEHISLRTKNVGIEMTFIASEAGFIPPLVDDLSNYSQKPKTVQLHYRLLRRSAPRNDETSCHYYVKINNDGFDYLIIFPFSNKTSYLYPAPKSLLTTIVPSKETTEPILTSSEEVINKSFLPLKSVPS